MGWALRGVSSSGEEGDAAASARAAQYPGEEAPRRRPVTPGPAGPSGLPPRHSLAPLHSARTRDRPAADRHRSSERASERASKGANQRPPPPRAGQQQASAKPGPTPLNGPLQPWDRKRDQPLGSFSAAQFCLPLLLVGVPVCHTLELQTRLRPWLSLVRAFFAPPRGPTPAREPGWLKERAMWVWPGCGWGCRGPRPADPKKAEWKYAQLSPGSGGVSWPPRRGLPLPEL